MLIFDFSKNIVGDYLDYDENKRYQIYHYCLAIKHFLCFIFMSIAYTVIYPSLYFLLFLL